MVVETVADLGHRTDRGDAAAGHDGDVVRQLLQFVQLVAGRQQTLPLLGQPAEQGDELGPADRVDAAERLVEDQQLRVVQQRLGQLDALAHPLGVAAQPPLRPAGHADPFQHRPGPPPTLGRRIAAQPGHRLHELPSRHFLVKRIHFRTVADVALRLRRPGVAPQDLHSAQIRPQMSGDEAHERTLAGAVGADQAGDARPQLQRHLVDADHGAVPLRDALAQQDGR